MDIKVLDSDFNPNSIAAGLYVTSADSPAYPVLTAMKLANDAKIVGIAFEEDGSETVAFKIGGGEKREVASNPRMVASQRWLQNAILDYSDWKSKWFRECVQNSVDAKATSVRLFTHKKSDGTVEAGCEDNGGGMALDVLLDKFLVLGGTTKEGGASTSGGFGKAKEMLILPWISWMIHTRDAVAVGAGDSYTVYEAQGGKWVWHQLQGETGPDFEAPPIPATSRNGTLLSVLMPSEKHTDIANAMAYVEKCYLPSVRFKFESNDPETSTSVVQASLRNGRHVRDIGGKASIYYTKNPKVDVSKILVRTKENLFMYDTYLPSEVSGYVVVQLLRPSVELMTSNRDGISDYEVRRALDAFVNELSANTLSALKAKKNLITEVYQGERFTARQQREAEANLVLSIGEMMQAKIGKEPVYEVTGDAKRFISDEIEKQNNADRAPHELVLGSNKVVVEACMDQKFSSREAGEVLAKQLVWVPGFIIHNDVEDFRVPSKFRPAGMTPSILRLAKVWTEFCRFVLTQMGSRREWGVGWIFSDDAKAALYTHNGEEWLVLNPFKSKDQEIYNPSDEADRSLLYAIAVHECTHIHNDVSQHNESFSTFMTINMGICTPGARKIKKIVESIPLRNQVEFDGRKRDKKIDGMSDDELLAELKLGGETIKWGEGEFYIGRPFGGGVTAYVIRTKTDVVVAWSVSLSAAMLMDGLVNHGYLDNQEYARVVTSGPNVGSGSITNVRVNVMDEALNEMVLDESRLTQAVRHRIVLKEYLRALINAFDAGAIGSEMPKLVIKQRGETIFDGVLTLSLVGEIAN